MEALRAVKWLVLGGVDWCGLPGQDALWSFLECCGPRLGEQVYTVAGLASEVLAKRRHPEMDRRAKALLLSCLGQCRSAHMVDGELWTVDAGVFDDTELRELSELRAGALAGSTWLQSVLK